MFSRKINYLVAVGAIAGLLGACATSGDPKTAKQDEMTFRGAAMETGRNIPNAAQAPLRDLNLTREEIPPLLEGLVYPYRVPDSVSCEDIQIEVRALNTVLGPDSDIAEEQLSMKERSAEAAAVAANNALEDVATGWIPYRSLVRRATGASAHEREIRKAYERGRLRRSFLKGLGSAKKCPYPASPASLNDPMPLSEIR